MPEKCKLKYLEICQDEDLVYEIIDEFNLFLQQNPFCSTEEKLDKLEKIKYKDFHLYQVIKEDINARIY